MLKKRLKNSSAEPIKFRSKEKMVSKFCSVDRGVGERRIRGEVIAKAVVDFIRVRMPE